MGTEGGGRGGGKVLLREAFFFVAHLETTTDVREAVFNTDPGIGPGSLNGIRAFWPSTTEDVVRGSFSVWSGGEGESGVQEGFREKLEILQVYMRQDSNLFDSWNELHVQFAGSQPHLRGAP